MSKDRAAYPDLPRRARRRLAAFSLLRSFLVSAAIFTVYALLPLSRPVDALTVLELVVGLVAVGALILWDLREIARSDHPRLRAVETLATVVPLFLLLFSCVYFLMERTHAGSFSTPLTRVDALYLSVTVLSTVGFGDITPVSQVARIIVTVQMLANLVLVGLVARVLLDAVQEGLRRQGRVPRQDEGDQDRGDRHAGDEHRSEPDRSDRPAG
jgi:hypothetical protein